VCGVVGDEQIRFHKLTVREIPHSGKNLVNYPDRYGWHQARAIVETVKCMVHD
jgi:hypothetical protein